VLRKRPSALHKSGKSHPLLGVTFPPSIGYTDKFANTKLEICSFPSTPSWTIRSSFSSTTTGARGLGPLELGNWWR
jgi:hypothetical protein